MNATVTTASARDAQQAGKYLTFALGKEEYGVQILKVREIIGYIEVTAVPGTPAYVKGVSNLRGQIISVVDLRTKFGMAPTQRTEQTCIIVVDIQRDGHRLNTGIIVDRVSEVLNIAAQDVEDTPSFGTSIDTSFILGMGKIGQGVKILLDIDKVLTVKDVTNLAAMPAAAQRREDFALTCNGESK